MWNNQVLRRFNIENEDISGKKKNKQQLRITIKDLDCNIVLVNRFMPHAPIIYQIVYAV